jgi:hypothetical protein
MYEQFYDLSPFKTSYAFFRFPHKMLTIVTSLTRSVHNTGKLSFPKVSAKLQLPQEWKESRTVPIYKADETGFSNHQAHHCYQLHTKFYPTSFSQG